MLLLYFEIEKLYGENHPKNKSLSPNGETLLDRKIHTDKELAKMTGVGTGTVARFNKVMNSEDEILADLIETNIRQRGDIGGSAKKTGLRIKELERLYGIEYGNNQHNRTTNNFNSSKTQEQLAKDMGMSVDTLQNYKMLADMIPELDELVSSGIVMPITALAIIKNFSEQK